jgi:hypothetical protein
MKNIIAFTIVLFSTLNVFAQGNEEVKVDISFNDIAQIVSSEFPEAYKDFMEISFIRQGKTASPGTASFLIPTAKLSKINSNEIIRRIKTIIIKMGDMPACPTFHLDKPTQYSWSKWKDKNVTKLYVDFNIGC